MIFIQGTTWNLHMNLHSSLQSPSSTLGAWTSSAVMERFLKLLSTSAQKLLLYRLYMPHTATYFTVPGRFILQTTYLCWIL